jgi:hypothetical protein
MSSSDVLIYPIVILSAIGLRYLLLLVGIQNNVIYLSVLFLFLHLLISLLLNYQLSDHYRSYLTPREVAGVGAMIVTMTAILGYVAISFIPALKLLFYPLRWIYGSQVWLDLFIVATPAAVMHHVVRRVGESLLKLSLG